MKLFVTGAESFIGKALLQHCRDLAIETVAIDSKPPLDSLTIRADIRDSDLADLIPQGAQVIHLAAISRDADCRTDPANAIDVNVTGTLNVAAAAQSRNASQFIFASSEWVYGDVRNEELQREDRAIDITRIKSEYALTKIVSEQCLRIGCKLSAVTVLRFGIVYGPRDENWSAVESLFNTVRTKDEVAVGSRGTARRFIYVDDIVAGILASRGRSGYEVFNLSGDRPITLGEVIETSARLLKRNPRVVESSATQRSVRNPDNGKAREALHWRPVVDLTAGLTKLDAYLSQRLD